MTKTFSTKTLLASTTLALGMLAVERSTKLPGKSLLTRAAVGAPLTTLYTRIGDLLGWLCVAAAVVLVVTSRRRST